MKINHLDKAEVLIALYNAAKIQGTGFFVHRADFKLTHKKASELLRNTTSFDYLNGKVLKIDLSGDELNTFLYNRDNGPNAAENAIQPLMEVNHSLAI